MLEKLAKIGHLPDDNTDLKIQKSFLVYLALFMSGGGLVWGTISLSYGLSFQSLFPYSYVVISVLNLIYFSSTKNFRPVRFIQVFISLVLPVLFQWYLGGFSASGIIILWSILSLIASLSFQSISSSINWLIFFVILVVTSGIYNDVAEANAPEILPDDSTIFIVTNIVLISSIIFGLVAFFVKKYEVSEHALEEQNKKLSENNQKLAKSYQVLKGAFGQMRDNRDSLKSELDAQVHDQLDSYEKILDDQKNILSTYGRN